MRRNGPPHDASVRANLSDGKSGDLLKWMVSDQLNEPRLQEALHLGHANRESSRPFGMLVDHHKKNRLSVSSFRRQNLKVGKLDRFAVKLSPK